MELTRRGALAGIGACAGGLMGCGGGGGSEPDVASPDVQGGVVALADVAVGQSVVAEVNGAKVAVHRTSETEVVAHTAVCTHTGCTVDAAGAELECPCHGSRFDATNGQVLEGPADAPLEAFPVRIEGPDVVVA